MSPSASMTRMRGAEGLRIGCRRISFTTYRYLNQNGRSCNSAFHLESSRFVCLRFTPKGGPLGTQQNNSVIKVDQRGAGRAGSRRNLILVAAEAVARKQRDLGLV